MKSKNLGRLLGGHPIVSWPNVHVRSRTGRNDGGGLQVMQEIVERRFPGWQEIIPQRLLILNYVNGEPWYDIHPLLNDEIKPFLEPADNEDDT